MNIVPPVILVVEDDPDLAQVLDDLLSLNGYAVVRAGSAPDAIAVLHQQAPALVLSDLNLSVGTGWEVYAFLRGQPHTHTLPFLLMSAYRPEIRDVADPFLCFMAKPFDPPALFACIQALLQQGSCTCAVPSTPHLPH
ncbi:MAG TPA: response regulator [Herpetosiphonaceae bacterium]